MKSYLGNTIHLSGPGVNPHWNVHTGLESLQGITKGVMLLIEELDNQITRKDEGEHPLPDIIGIAECATIVTAYAAEIAIKTLIAQTKPKQKPLESHDLLKLFDQLDQDIQKKVQNTFNTMTPIGKPNWRNANENIRQTIDIGRNNFVGWRYRAENKEVKNGVPKALINVVVAVRKVTLDLVNDANDIHGFIRNQNIHGDVYTHFYRGFACANRANEASTPEEKQGQYEEAITHFTKAIKLKSDFAEAYINRGIAYYKRNDFDNAIKDFVKAIQLKPDSAEAYYNRGNAYYKKGEVDNAINDYTEAIRLNPDSAEAYYNRGNAYYEKGEVDNAINDYTEAIRLNPDLVEAYYNRGNAYDKKAQFDNAIRDYNTVIKLNPDLDDAHHNRGVFYHRKGEFDNAINDYTKAIEFKPDYANAYYNRGAARLHLQEWEKAKSDLITAKDMDVDIIAAFHNDCENVEDFEQRTGIRLPEDIAALLTPPQA